MKIEIHIRDTTPTGKRLGGRRLSLESCRVFREAGDGVRLNNLAVPAALFFKAACMVFLKDDPINKDETMTLPNVDRLEKLKKDEVLHG